MTSNDRHASHDSPYRTGQHVPLNQHRHEEPLTSVATSAIESRPDLTSLDDSASKPSAASNSLGSSGGITSPARPYSPGMRSLSSQQRRSQEQEGVDAGEIQMQSFHDGAPPPPPVSHSWKKIDRWLEKNYEELYDQLGEGCTLNDVNELEHDLDCSLPLEIRESLQVHDGQERGGLPSGVVFGCMLLDCEEIVQEWRNWRTVNEEFLSAASTITQQPQPPVKAYGGSAASSSSTPTPARPSQQQSNPLWRQELLDRQDSQPPRAIQKAYAHPSWIPLARDWGGNNIAVDLAPGPAGKWGQVIIFGRDFDCKYVIARSWSAFVAVFADDIQSGKTLVDEDSGEMCLKQFKDPNVNPPYLQILRWRGDQKHGRKPAKRKSANGLGVSTGVNGKSGRESPYGSPAPSVEERGRSPHRFPPRGPNASPKTTIGVSSPLARVTEEGTAPNNKLNTGEVAAPATADGGSKAGDLVDITSPSPSSSTKLDGPIAHAAKSRESNQSSDKPKQGSSTTTPRSSTGLDSKTIDGMKNVEI